MLDNPVLIAAARTIQTHLKVLVIDHDMMERKLTVGKDLELPARCPLIFDLNIPQFQRIPNRHA